MTRTVRIWLSALVAASAPWIGPVSLLGDDSTSVYGAEADEDSVFVHGQSDESDAVGSEPDVTTYEYKRMPRYFCGTDDGILSPIPCVEGTSSGRVIRYCADGSEALDPLYRRPVNPATGLFTGPWERVDNGGCPGEDELVVFTAADFRRLPLTASVPAFQPAHGRSLVNLGIVVFTGADSQYLSTTVLGTDIRVRATPSSYAWDFGDGTAPLVTTSPGAPYPSNTLRHAYASIGSYQVRLVTTWTGVYQVGGAGSWLRVDGTAQTTSAAFTITAEEAPTYLVADPLG